MQVIIDGVLYVPATEAIANTEAIVRGLVDDFWGDCPKKKVKELCENLSVRVFDDGNGIPIENVLAAIVKYSK